MAELWEGPDEVGGAMLDWWAWPVDVGGATVRKEEVNEDCTEPVVNLLRYCTCGE